ncbi:MAG TPA: Fic family protein [Myxococcales bacterium]
MASDDDEVDPLRTFTAEEKRQLTEHLCGLTEAAHAGKYSDIAVRPEFICSLHGELFTEVRDHAGKIRARGWGQEYLTFGPNRSSHRNDVKKEIEKLCERGEIAARSIVSSKLSHDYEYEALKLALRWHADFIKIHPFEDGNGRTGRLMLAILLVRLGLRPIPVEVPRLEYNEALNHYYRNLDLDVLVDLFIGLID